MTVSGTPTYIPPERIGHAAPADLVARRAGLAAAVTAGYGRTDPPAEEIRIGGVRALRFRPRRASRGTILHIHGGAFRIGCPETVAVFAAALSERCGVTLICPAYRLAPEHPFPAGIADARGVMTALIEEANAPLILSGDSAGGGIAAALAVLGAADAIPPAGLILLSAWLDLRVASKSYASNAAQDPLFSEMAAREAADLYLQGHSAAHPLASPLTASPADFPPTLINVGAGEVLLDDSVRLDAALRATGVPVQLQIVPGMDHVAVTRDAAAPGAAETFAAVAAFVDGILGTAD